ncbi:MAG TPA: TonB-dependent receptor [Cellvibrio sp.]|nr:TonB-dependent receptor [Cellvibrio sp.]
MNKLKFNHLLALVSTMTLAAGSQAVYAQGAEEPEEIVITGFRASLQNSIAAKQDSSSIVEAVYAEDIGKLPDTSIAETLARLPGLAGARTDGRTSGISLRGFNENYVGTTMNGRELLGIGDNRGVEFDLYPSEIVAGAMVYKTPDASLVTQGLGGVIDFKTLRPLDKDRIISFSANYEQNDLESANPDYDDKGHRLSFTYSDKFVDDKLGVALTVATLETPSQEQQYRAWGFATVDSVTGKDWQPRNENGTVKNQEQVDNPDRATRIIGGQDSYVRSSLTERDTFAGVVQFQPTDELGFTFDALYVDFSESKVFRGFEEGMFGSWTGGQADETITTVKDGIAVAGTSSGYKSVIRNDAESKDGKLTTFGLNAKWQVTDTWALTGDIATGKTEKDLINLESYSGVGRANSAGQGAGASRSYVLNSKGAMFTSLGTQPNYADPNLIRLAGPQAWGGAIGPLFKDDAHPDGRNDQQDGFVNNPTFDEELTTLRLQANGEVEFSIINAVEVGVNYSDRTKSKDNYGAFLTSPAFFAENPVAGAPYSGGDEAVPGQFVVGTADLSFIGLGQMLAYDSLALYKSGYYYSTESGKYQSDRKGDTYEVNEKVATLYGLAKFETGILTGNVGLQVVSTDQSASGYDSYNGPGGLVIANPVEDGDKYVQLLPSLNMNFQITEEQVIRFAASKTQSRARMDYLKPGNTIGFDFDTGRRQSDNPTRSAWSSATGNSQLKPTEAIQFDLSYEYYFADDGLLSASYFFKDLQNWHVSRASVDNFDSYYIEGYHNVNLPEVLNDDNTVKIPANTLISKRGPVTSWEEAGAGYVQGTELQASVPFHIFHDVLDGAGVTYSVAFLDGQIDYSGGTLQIPGMSRVSRQLTAYYEKHGFEFRISGRERSKFRSEERGLSLSLVDSTDLGAELWDAQIGYDFSETGVPGLEGLNVRLQVQNLTDEDTSTADTADSRLITKYQHFGRNYLLGVTYKF